MLSEFETHLECLEVETAFIWYTYRLYTHMHVRAARTASAAISLCLELAYPYQYTQHYRLYPSLSWQAFSVFSEALDHSQCPIASVPTSRT